MLTKRSLNLLAVLSILLATVAAPAIALPPSEAATVPPTQSQTSLQPTVVPAVKHDVSPALRSLKSSVAQSTERFDLGTRSLAKNNAANLAPTQSDVDMSVQSWHGPTSMPTPIKNFAGISNTYGVAPPDTQGEIGYDPATNKKYYVQWVNLGFAVWDVTGDTPVKVLGPLNGNTLWTGFGGACETVNDGDPITLYDPIAHRWMMTQFALPNYPSGPFYQCIAVSTSGDPTGTYYRYAYEWQSGTTDLMNDYPKFGVWPDGYYMTANQFNGNNWAGTGVAAFERDRMLIGATARMVYFDLGVSDWGGMLPSDLDGLTPPPADAPNYFVEVHADEWDNTPAFTQDEAAVYAFDVDWTTPANSTFTPVATLAMSPFDGNMCPWPTPGRDCIPQQGTTQKLDAIADRTMYRLAYRNFGGHESFVSNLTVDVDGTDRAGVRWFEVRKAGTTWSLYQEGTYAPDATHRWMGSVAMDRVGNIAVGYSASSSSVYPSVRYAGRLASDPLGILPQGEVELIAGTTAQSGVNRWGDYSMMSVDPVDDCTFWYTSEYSAGSWDWRTRIGSFKFPNCTSGPQGTLAGTVTNAATSAPIAYAQIQAAAGVTQTYATSSGANGAYALQMPVGTYNVTASAYGYQNATINGVSVISGTTTTLPISLTAAPTYLITGTVTDAATGWPLYAHISIAGDPINPPAPYDTAWTDPVTGKYTVTLVGGITYTLNVASWVSGYTATSRSFAPLTTNRQENFALAADATCTAPGRSWNYAGVLYENFDSVTPPALPTGWAKVVVTSTSTAANWATNAGTRYPSGQPAHSAPNLVYFNSFSSGTGGSARLYRTTGFNMTTATTTTMSLWMYHDTGYTSNNDRVQVQVSIDGGTTWLNVGAPISRYDTTVGWKQHAVDLSAYAAATDLRLGLLGISAYGNDVHIDDVSIGLPTCQINPGGLVVGNVFDGNTAAALNGATVTNDSGRSTLSAATVDPNVADGFYTLFSPSGAHAFTATLAGGYVPAVQTPTVIANSTIRQNLALQAGKLAHTPLGVAAVLTSGLSSVVPVTLTNSGLAPLTFNLVEVNTPVVQAPTGPFAATGRHLGPKNLGLTSLSGVLYYINPPSGVPQLSGGQVLNTWATGLTAPWGVGFNTTTDDLWINNIKKTGGDGLLYRFLRDSSPTGTTVAGSNTATGFWADMAYEPNTNRLWQIDVGTDNCLYEMDPAAQTFTERKVCPPFGNSQRGLAFDPATGTFYSGSWNDGIVHHFALDGTVLDSKQIDIAVAGLAYNPATKHLFATAHDDAGYDIYVLDAANGYALLGGFDVTGLGNFQQAGLEMSCDGHLWAVNQSTQQVLEIDSGETSVCDNLAEIPWLSTSPITGTIAASSQQVVNFTFDAASTQPGTYRAQVQATNNTPYGVDFIPVTLTVNTAPSWGTVAGLVRGLGYCDASPVPLSNATVVLSSGNGSSWTVQTDGTGHYQYSLDQNNSPITLTTSYTGYVISHVSGVAIVANTTITQNIDLRLNQPCISAVPSTLQATVRPGTSVTRTLTLRNTGAGASPYSFFELPGIITGSLRTAAPAPMNARHAPAQAGMSAPIRLHASVPDGVLITEGFEGTTFPPTGWQEVINNANFNWSTATNSPHGGTTYADIVYDSTLVDQNEWLLTPEMSLTGGTLSLWSFGSVYWCKTTYDNCDLNIWIVVGAVGGGNDILVGTADDAWTANWTWAQSVYNLTPLLPGGPVRIGFQYIGNDGAEVALDDVLLDGQVGGDVPWLSELPISGTLAADTSLPIVVTFTAAPTMTTGTYTATIVANTNDPQHPYVYVPTTMIIARQVYLPLIVK